MPSNPRAWVCTTVSPACFTITAARATKDALSSSAHQSFRSRLTSVRSAWTVCTVWFSVVSVVEVSEVSVFRTVVLPNVKPPVWSQRSFYQMSSPRFGKNGRSPEYQATRFGHVTSG